MGKYKIVILIFVILITGLGLALVYLWYESPVISDDKNTFPATKSPPAPSVPEEQLSELWLNGERCPKRGFAIQSPPEDIVQAPDGSRVFVNIVNVNFIDNTEACEDAERIAQLLNAKIVGFGPTTNTYGFQISTRTVAELNAAMAQIDALNDPKIEGVFPSFEIRAIVPPF